jgi:hypothetical protein
MHSPQIKAMMAKGLNNGRTVHSNHRPFPEWLLGEQSGTEFFPQ